MKIAATIAEFNPMHSGHVRLINEVKKTINPDIFAVILSGNFSERGDVTVKNKHVRAGWAIKAGADIVVELPFFYAVNCAEKFAEGAMKVLSCFGQRLTVAFGSESGNLNELERLSATVHSESEEDKKKIRAYLKEGNSLIRARAGALDEKGLFTPNNTLAIEYIESAKKYGFDSFTIKRESGFNDLSTENEFASAQAIRNCIFEDNFEKIDRFLPDFVKKSLNNCVFNNDMSDLIKYRLHTMKTEEIKRLPEVTEGLENRIKSALEISDDYDSLIRNVKSKRYTMARIKRILLYALTGLTADKMNYFYSAPPYARVLAVRDDKKEALKLLAENGCLVVNFKDVGSLPETVKDALYFENTVDGVYSVLSKSREPFNATFIK